MEHYRIMSQKKTKFWCGEVLCVARICTLWWNLAVKLRHEKADWTLKIRVLSMPSWKLANDQMLSDCHSCFVISRSCVSAGAGESVFIRLLSYISALCVRSQVY